MIYLCADLIVVLFLSPRSRRIDIPELIGNFFAYLAGDIVPLERSVLRKNRHRIRSIHSLSKTTAILSL